MVEAGLLVSGDDIPVPWDSLPRPRDVSDHGPPRPRHRVRRRALEKDVPAKYLNSPETPLFHKATISTTSPPRARPA